MVIVYLQKNYDSDLIGLKKRVGDKAFRKIALLSLESLTDPEKAKSARELARLPETEFCPSASKSERIRLSLSSKEDELFARLLKGDGAKRSAFVKCMIRHTLGAGFLIKAMLPMEHTMMRECPSPTAIFFTGESKSGEKRTRSAQAKKPRLHCSGGLQSRVEIQPPAPKPEPVNSACENLINIEEEPMVEVDVLSMLEALM